MALMGESCPPIGSVGKGSVWMPGRLFFSLPLVLALLMGCDNG